MKIQLFWRGWHAGDLVSLVLAIDIRNVPNTLDLDWVYISSVRLVPVPACKGYSQVAKRMIGQESFHAYNTMTVTLVCITHIQINEGLQKTADLYHCLSGGVSKARNRGIRESLSKAQAP